MNLDERIELFNVATRNGYTTTLDVFAPEVKQLIRDVLDYVEPERDVVSGTDYSVGRNNCITEMQAKRKELAL
jgi:hypothetical protein